MEGPDGPQPARFQVPAGVEDPTAVNEQTSAPMRSLNWSLPDGRQKLRLDDREMVIGRGPEVTLPLSDRLVSRRHARIYLESGRARLKDVGSANGTFLNGERIAGEAFLHAEDVIRLGSAELTFHKVGSPTPPLSELLATRVMAVSVDGAQSIPGPYTLHLRTGPGSPRVIAWHRTHPFTIGRAEGNCLVIDDPIVSRHQAELAADGDQIFVHDLGSANGTFLNWTRVQGRQIAQPGDVLQMGATELVIIPAIEAPSASPALGRGAASPTPPPSLRGTVSLRQIKPFDELEATLFDVLEPAFTLIEYRDADVILDHPEKRVRADRDAMLVVLEGEASVQAAVAENWGAAVELTRLESGDYCGERAVAFGHTFPHKLVALHDVKAFHLTRKDFEHGTAGQNKLTSFFRNRVVPLGAIKYLRTVPIFSRLPRAAWVELVTTMKPQSFVAGEVIARRGEPCRTFFLFTSGRARANKLYDKRERLLTYLEEGKFVGEEVAGSAEVYPLMVIAETEAAVFTLTQEEWQSVQAKYEPEVADSSTDGPDSPLPVSVIFHRVAPFDMLPPELVTPLAERVRQKRFDPGEVIVRQGESASSYYIIQRGTVDVRITESTGKERSVAALKAGESFGESSLITEHQRNASVVATAPTTALALYRSDFYDILEQGRRYGMGLEFSATLNQRGWPKKIANVEVVRHETGTGQVSYVLHNLQNDKYMSLTEEGLFVWNMLTGDYTLTDIAVAYSSQFHTLSMKGLFNTIAQLQRLGFLEIDQEKLLRLMPDFQLTAGQRTLLTLSRIFRWSIELKHADGLVAKVHRALGRLLYARPVFALCLLVCAAGVPAFVYELAHRPKSATFAGLVLVSFALAYLLSIFFHEWGHALTVKQMGRRVIGGVGWMYVSPYVYVNTSDMWLAGKWRRIAVTCAGPTVNLIIGSATSLAALAVSDPTASRFLIQLATINFVFVLANLNPLMELDGYYLLMDWLEIPGLRRKALLFLGKGDFKTCMRDRTGNKRFLASSASSSSSTCFWPWQRTR